MVSAELLSGLRWALGPPRSPWSQWVLGLQSLPRGEPEVRRGVVWNPSSPHPAQLLAVLGQVYIWHILYTRPGFGVSDWPGLVCSRSGGLSVYTELSLALLDELVTPVAPSTEGGQGR